MDNPVPPDRMVHPVVQEVRDLPEYQVMRARQGIKDHLEPLVPQELMDNLDLLDNRDYLAPQVPRDPLVRLGLQVKLEPLETKDPAAHQGRQGPLDNKVPKVNQGPQVSQETKVQLVSLVIMVNKDLAVRRVLSGPLVLRA